MNPKLSQSRRRSTRLRGYDYGQTGGYFVTICVQDQKCLFGKIIDGQMQLNDIGKIVIECWNRIPQHFFSAELDVYVVMPNHLHGIILLNTKRSTSACPSFYSQPNRHGEVPSPVSPNRRTKIPSPTLGQVVAYFKYQSTKCINQLRDMPGTRVWQRNYYDHVLRDDIDLQRIRQYITDNPMQWQLDQLHPDNFTNKSGWVPKPESRNGRGNPAPTIRDG